MKVVKEFSPGLGPRYPAGYYWVAYGRTLNYRCTGMGDTRAEAISDMRCQMDRCDNPKHKKRRPRGCY